MNGAGASCQLLCSPGTEVPCVAQSHTQTWCWLAPLSPSSHWGCGVMSVSIYKVLSHSNTVYLEKPNLIDLCCDPLQAPGNKAIPSYYLGTVSLLSTNASHISEHSSHLLMHPVTLLKPDTGQIWQWLAQCIPLPRLSTSARARSTQLPARAELIRGEIARQSDSSQLSRGRNRLCLSRCVPDNRSFQLHEECRRGWTSS